MHEGYELDFLPVGKESKSGDAIALRFGNLNGAPHEQTVVVIDGGYEENGEALVDHIARYYNTQHVDLVISTHPDGDHIGGLKTVLNELSVGVLWMHQPWRRDHLEERSLYTGQVPTKRMRNSLQRSLSQAYDLEELAQSKGIPIEHPFQGRTAAGGRIQVLGPTEDLYAELLQEYTEAQDATLSMRENPLARLLETGKDVVARVAERWDLETLTDDCNTSPQNNSSVVLLLTLAGRRLLLTADAGARAIDPVVSMLETGGICPGGLDLVQVPHHGSRRNVRPSLLDRLLGQRTVQGATSTTSAYASVAEKGEPKHPSKRVANAFRRRGAPVCVTQGQTICHRRNAPTRAGWGPIVALPFYEEVEEVSGT